MEGVRVNILNILRKIRYTFQKLSSPGKSLSSRVVKGGFWVFSLRITDRVFQLVRTIILARLLSPNDFGLFGIALLVLSILETFTESGFQHALIQKKGETKSYLDTAWTIGLIRGSTIAAIIFFIAKPASIFFDAPAAQPILKVIGFSIILYSLSNISVLYFQKELEFQKYFKYQFSGTLADVAVAITSAILLKSVWALVLGLLAGNLVRCIMSYVIEPYKPKIRFNTSQAKELFSFGKWVLGSTIIIFLLTNGDDIFVGKLLGVTMLGFYQMAYKISNLPATEITHVISQVSFPAYSKLQDNILKLREAYLRILQLTTFISFPVAGLIFTLAPEFTHIFLGDKWIPIVPAIQILCLFGVTRSVNATFGPLYQAVGLPKILTKVSLIQLSFLIIIIYPFTVRGGIVGVSIAVTIANLLCLIIASYEAFRILKMSYRILFNVLKYPILVTISIVIFIYIVKFIILDKIPLYYTFIISLLIWLCIYPFYAKIAGFSFKRLLNEGKPFKKIFIKDK